MARQLAGCGIVLQQVQRRAAVEMPQLVGLYCVPTAELMAFQQIVDGCNRGTGAACRLDSRWRTIDLAIPATLRMRLQRELLNQIPGSSIHLRFLAIPAPGPLQQISWACRQPCRWNSNNTSSSKGSP